MSKAYGKIKDPALKKAWLHDLENRTLKQCQKQLCTMTKHGGHASYCCLGVLGLTIKRTKAFDITRPVMEKPELFSDEKMVGRGIFFDGEKSMELLPKNLAKKIGLTGNGQVHLAEMNDKGKTFKEIAAWIRKHL